MGREDHTPETIRDLGAEITQNRHKTKESHHDKELVAANMMQSTCTRSEATRDRTSIGPQNWEILKATYNQE